MKRDMDLARNILLRMEEDAESFDGLSDNPETVSEHLWLLRDAGLIEATPQMADGKILSMSAERITWDGHDFLDASRESAVWELAKEHVIGPGLCWTFALLLEWLKAQAHQRLFGVPASS